MADLHQKLLKTSKAINENRRGIVITAFCTMFIVITAISLIVFIAIKGLAIFVDNRASLLNFLISDVWQPGNTSNGRPLIGALAMIVGSFGVTLLALMLAMPFGLALSLFVTQYAKKRVKDILQIVLDLFTGIPSVVYGFLGLILIVPVVRKIYGGTGFGLLSGAVVLAVMILPTITSIMINAINGVPISMIRASLALGATRWQTIYKIILRFCLPGLLIGVIFGMARALGEAMAVQMVIGNTVLLPKGLATPTTTLTSQLTVQMGNTIFGTVQNNALWTLALFLLLISLVFNVLIRTLAKKGNY
ncbi:MAG: phosphate ABC transporter permease subunit PstC [Lactobacillus iners]|nr:phosphate ABC transporter permease subunit PstC [Lactobacillus iners]